MMVVLCTISRVEGQSAYACPPGTQGWPCLRGADGKPLTVKVLFMDKNFVTTNPAAVAKVNSMGRDYFPGVTCNQNATAVPECFVFENWSGGWIGAYMQQALKDLGLNVIALTPANFSAEALQVATISDFTRCVWEVKFRHVDLCVGDFWETPERRNLVPFTAPIDSDFFTLYTILNPAVVRPPPAPKLYIIIISYHCGFRKSRPSPPPCSSPSSPPSTTPSGCSAPSPSSSPPPPSSWPRAPSPRATVRSMS